MAELASHATDRPASALSTIVLAGGKSQRMGSDKAFLKFRGRYFVSIVVAEAARFSDEILIVIGSKDARRFAESSPGGVRVIQDQYRTANPIGGMVTGFLHVGHRYSAVVACDLPLLRGEILPYLHERADGHSAAVPRWDNGDTEPLCAVYDATLVAAVCLAEMKKGALGPRNLLQRLPDVEYVPVGDLKRFDPDLVSFTNVNSVADYGRLGALEDVSR